MSCVKLGRIFSFTRKNQWANIEHREEIDVVQLNWVYQNQWPRYKKIYNVYFTLRSTFTSEFAPLLFCSYQVNMPTLHATSNLKLRLEVDLPIMCVKDIYWTYFIDKVIRTLNISLSSYSPWWQPRWACAYFLKRHSDEFVNLRLTLQPNFKSIESLWLEYHLEFVYQILTSSFNHIQVRWPCSNSQSSSDL